MRVAMRVSRGCISTSRCDITNTLFAARERSREVFESRFSTLAAPIEVESRVLIPSLVLSRDGTRVVTRDGEDALVVRRTARDAGLLTMSAKPRAAL